MNVSRRGKRGKGSGEKEGMNQIEKWLRNYQQVHRRKRINWERGRFEHKPFGEFVRSIVTPRLGERGVFPLAELIEAIRLEYYCSYGVAYYKLMGWIKENSDKYSIEWRGTRCKYIVWEK